MSVFTNPSSGAAEQAAAYVSAILELLGSQDPMSVLRETPAALRRAIEGVAPATMKQPEKAGKWSIAQVLQHLADSDLVWGWRLRLILAQDRPTITGYDQDQWADRLQYDEADPAESLETFGVLRRANLRLIDRASPQDLKRVGVHAERGEESIDHLRRLYAGHDLMHLQQIERVRKVVSAIRASEDVMRSATSLLSFIVGLTLCVPNAGAQTFDKDVATLVDKVSVQAIQIRQEIHKNPELSNREVRTAELVAKHLRALGLKVNTGIARTGVIGVLKGKGPGPVIAVRADMDALPVTEAGDLPFKSTARTTYAGREVGVSHACGHDIHVAAALGAASVLSSLRDRLNGTVMFIFQPAEEGPPPGEKGGAGLMVEEGIFKELKPDAIIALHANGDPLDEAGDDERLGRISYTPGPAFAASTKWTAVVRGRSAHGATPHLSVDPVVTASQVVLALQTLRSRILPPLSANVVTVGIIRGGDRNNIIPAEVYLEGTIRTFDTGIQDTLEQRMRDIFDGTTKAAHATYELSFDRSHPLTTNDRALTERLVPTLQRVVGKDDVVVAPPETGAEDFSFFSNIVPGFYFKLGVVPEGKASGGHHTPTFYADDKAVPIGIRTLSTLVLDYLASGKR